MKRDSASASPRPVRTDPGLAPVAPVPAATARRLRVSRRYPEPARRLRYTLPQPVPMLRFSGQWLTEAGFRIGDTVNIDVVRGQLVLTRSERSHP
ncbi:MAG TPA: SymE family type I addiction module toxin [Thermoanaerobaculia bacterium]|nr:SymE family type I addiction module toxin [Thermoanaerobaculia bacterium]